ncbi:magnesium/cobalt transporter CorA [Lysobacter ciconiae]|uniref:Magnesium transport protein CorA n=1 Tax=Novilysobacter ciconiae TaxID=2781022 RepID=A0A7S6UHC4_9GAMM|nr:magnesium/cobalt transporter CorA [Lysobacter ciconiae]QOW20287.1 magnesium/cobalt transporter CorA [Lysobacter ciconiae]
MSETPAAAPYIALPRSVMSCAVYSADGVRTDIDLDSISDALAVDDGSFVWVGLYEPDGRVLNKLQKEFGLHDLAIEDAGNAHQRPKIETYGNSLFIALHTAQNIEGALNFGETHLFVGPRYLMTVRHGASSSYGDARARMEREPDLLRHGPSAALYVVLDMVVDRLLPIVDEFGNALNALEADIFADEFDKKTVQKLYDLKRELTRLRLAVAPLQDVLSHLARPRADLIDEEMRLYFRDVLDHAVRINENTDTLREMLTAAVNVNLALVTVRQGEVVKRMGAWAALLAVPTLVTGWYGMNFDVMPELHGRLSYPLLAVLVAAGVFSLYRAFKRSGWL